MLNAAPHRNADSQESAYRFIKGRILDLVYRPNQRLRASDIAEVLQSSRTPVREALGRLAQEGLVEKDSGWGYIVKAVSLADVLNLFKVREALEIEALREAFPCIDDSVLDLLRQRLDAAERALEAGDVSRFLAINRAFHRLIAETAANPILQSMLGSIADRIRMGGAMVIQHYGARALEILDENRKILAALRERDLALAETALRAHITRARETVVAHIGRDPAKLFIAA